MVSNYVCFQVTEAKNHYDSSIQQLHHIIKNSCNQPPFNHLWTRLDFNGFLEDNMKFIERILRDKWIYYIWCQKSVASTIFVNQNSPFHSLIISCKILYKDRPECQQDLIFKVNVKPIVANLKYVPFFLSSKSLICANTCSILPCELYISCICDSCSHS